MHDPVESSVRDGLATLTLSRGKVNAIDEHLVDSLKKHLLRLEKDDAVRAVILTGRGSFFSFGFDIPHFLSFAKDDFTAFVEAFTDVYTRLFLFPKPVVAALNGHAVAGGCMLAIACDRRVMVTGKARIALNEITFGASVFAGSTEMLRFCTGSANATRVLYSGAMMSAGEAEAIGLVDDVVVPEELPAEAERIARELGSRNGPTFAHIKALLRRPAGEEIRRREKDSIREWIDIWYSQPTWSSVQQIKIRD